jgi:cytochrome c2
MMRMIWLSGCAIGVVMTAVVATMGIPRAQTPAPGASPLPVTFTAAQVQRGREAYVHECQDCHGSTLDNGDFGGPVLNGSYFRQHWGSASVGALYSYTMTTMPADRPGRLDPQTYLDLTAFILSHNGYAPGDTDMPSDSDALDRMSLAK